MMTQFSFFASLSNLFYSPIKIAIYLFSNLHLDLICFVVWQQILQWNPDLVMWNSICSILEKLWFSHSTNCLAPGRLVFDPVLIRWALTSSHGLLSLLDLWLIGAIVRLIGGTAHVSHQGAVLCLSCLFISHSVFLLSKGTINADRFKVPRSTDKRLNPVWVWLMLTPTTRSTEQLGNWEKKGGNVPLGFRFWQILIYKTERRIYWNITDKSH